MLYFQRKFTFEDNITGCLEVTTSTVFFKIKFVFLDALIPFVHFLIIEIYNFRGDLSKHCFG